MGGEGGEGDIITYLIYVPSERRVEKDVHLEDNYIYIHTHTHMCIHKHIIYI